MKTRILKNSAGSIIFLLLVIGVVALIKPVHERIEKFSSLQKEKIFKTVKEKTGLDISYEKFSPSIFSGINFEGISVKDGNSGKTVLEVSRVSVSYSFKDLLKNGVPYGIKLLLLDGVSVEIDGSENSQLLENLVNIFGSSSKKDKSEKKIVYKGQQIEIPFDIQLKNLSVEYRINSSSFNVSLKNLVLQSRMGFEGGVGVKASGQIEIKTEKITLGGKSCVFASNFSLSGTFFEKFEGSSFMFRLSESSRGDISLARIDLLLNCENNKLILRNMRNPLPYSLSAQFNYENMDAEFSFQSDKFEPLKLLKLRKNPSFIKKIAGTVFTSALSGGFSLENSKNILSSLKFDFDFTLKLPEKLLPGNTCLSSSLSCRNKVIDFHTLKADGSFVEAEYSGTFDIENMQPSGVFSLNQFLLGNGQSIQTEIYIDPYKNGFLCFAPQFFLGEKSFTALQFIVLPSSSSIDFSLEFDDYSHIENEKSAHVKIDGSFINEKKNIIQASLSLEDMFLDSVAQTLAVFLDGENAKKTEQIAESLSTFIFSSQLFFTTDFSSFSFNSPFSILANTAAEKQIIAFEIDGSNQTVSLNSLDLQFSDNTAHASAGVEFVSGLKDFNFFANLVVNSVPYNFAGSFESDFFNVSGDYDFSAVVKNGKVSDGYLHFNSLPVSLGKSILAVSLDSTFRYSSQSGPQIEIENFDIEEPSGNIAIKPHVAFSGSANRYGFVFDKIAYSDTVSALEGKAQAVWSFNDGIFDSILFDLNAASLIAGEKINLNAEFRNPDRKKLSMDSFLKDFYITSQGNVAAFPFARILSDQTGSNFLNFEFSASGTLENPFVSVSASRSSVNIAGFPAFFGGNVLYDENGLTVSDFILNWGVLSVTDASAVFDPKTFQGSLSALVRGEALENDFNIPLTLKIQSLSPESKPAENFIASLSSTNMTGSFFPSGLSLKLMAVKTPGQLEIISNQGKGFSLTMFDGGFLQGKSGELSPVKFELSGSMIHNNLDISIKNISSDLSELCRIITIPYVKFSQGTLSGAVKISGITTDPEFTGAVTVTKPEFQVPFVSKKIFRSEKVFASAGQNSFSVKPVIFTLDKIPVEIGVNIEFDRWGIDFLDCSINTEDGVFVPVDMQFPFVRFKGYAGFEKFLIHLTNDVCAFYGKITGQKADIIVAVDNQLSEVDESEMDFLVNLDLAVKNKVQLLFNPVLRGVIVPGTSLGFYLDTATSDFVVKGDVALRGGEIVWLNRSFYMKEGKVVFNESKVNFDPRITVRAETRERDDKGAQVTIVLSAQGQQLSSFNPRISSIPSKSESEIMEILGNVISADSSNAASLAMAGGDYIIQTTLMKGIENALRELCNFDIFSIRTSLLQNAVKYRSNDSKITFRNYFDNSAVYVGKYFGEAVYVDALMHFSFNDDKNDKLIFQPSVGVEMESPFVNIRFGFSPDLERIQNSPTNFLLPATSITLSKKIVF